MQVLEALLRLLHPIMPFITEEIWQRVAPLQAGSPAADGSRTIMLQPYPRVPHGAGQSTPAEAEMQWVMQFILGIRKIKGEMNIAPGKPVPVLLADSGGERIAQRVGQAPCLPGLPRPHRVDHRARTRRCRPESATALVGDMKVLIPMAGLIDKDAELARLDKEIARLRQDIERTENKLGNPAFVDKAPAAVVQKERDKMAKNEAALQNLSAQAQKIRAL